MEPTVPWNSTFIISYIHFFFFNLIVLIIRNRDILLIVIVKKDKFSIIFFLLFINIDTSKFGCPNFNCIEKFCVSALRSLL